MRGESWGYQQSLAQVYPILALWAGDHALGSEGSLVIPPPSIIHSVPGPERDPASYFSVKAQLSSWVSLPCCWGRLSGLDGAQLSLSRAHGDRPCPEPCATRVLEMAWDGGPHQAPQFIRSDAHHLSPHSLSPTGSLVPTLNPDTGQKSHMQLDTGTGLADPSPSEQTASWLQKGKTLQRS